MVRGRVQGVGYRVWAMETGQALDLDGWARNRRDGSVEILAMGETNVIERLVEACRVGPPAALVSSLEQLDAEDDGAIGFHVRPTV
jgi:acylphosphatase